MKPQKMLLTAIPLLLAACGGGGGGISYNPQPTTTVTPEISVSGPSTVWSDDYAWSATASASDMDSSTVGFTISGGDESTAIDSVTGEINSEQSFLKIGPNRFIVSATDASGANASTTYDIRSDAFIAGLWAQARQCATPGGPILCDTPNVLYTTRSGKYFSATYRAAAGGGFDRCFGSFTITGADLDGVANCRSAADDAFSVDVEATANRYDMTLDKTTVTEGYGAGSVNAPSTLQRIEGALMGNIPAGRYFKPTGVHGSFEIMVNTDGSFNTLPADENAILTAPSDCDVSGNIAADPLYGLATESGHFSQHGLYDATFTATGCSDDFDQDMTDIVVGSRVSSYDSVTATLALMTPGNPESNGGANASEMVMIQICDEFNQPTALGLELQVQANCTRPSSE